MHKGARLISSEVLINCGFFWDQVEAEVEAFSYDHIRGSNIFSRESRVCDRGVNNNEVDIERVAKGAGGARNGV